ncbi:MAG: CAP domain-containing protein, partial [Candidatus Staskawiczbacteria bacterium]
QVEKQILSPAPLNAGGASNNVVLLQSKIISETNLQRQENGNLPQLTENANLDKAASAKANDMFVNQYFEHTSPSGVDPGKLVENNGYDYIVAGENLILGNFSSEKEVVDDWMASPGHRANILNVRYTEIGVSIIKGTYKGQTVWIGVQEFGLPSSACEEPNAALKNQIDSEESQLDVLSSQIDANKTEIDNADRNSPAYSQMIDVYNQSVSQYNSLASQAKGAIAEYNNQVNNFNNCIAGK